MGEAKVNAALRLREMLGVPGKDGLKHFQIQYLYNDTHMIMAFQGVRIDNLTMTVEQIDEVISALQGLRAAFVEHHGKTADMAQSIAEEKKGDTPQGGDNG